MAANRFDIPIVKFRRGDKYEEMPGLDTLPIPSAGESSTSRTRQTGSDYGGLVHRQLHTEPESSSSTTEIPKDMTPDDILTVDRAVEVIGFGWFQIKLSIFTGLVWMADAMEMMILSILSPALHCEWALEAWQQALLTTVVFSGMMLSSCIWGKICDKYGRKVELIMCSMFTLYFGILSSFAPNFIWILILRGLVGFGIGGVPQSITLYAEFLPSSTRARCIVLIETISVVEIRYNDAKKKMHRRCAAINLFIFFLACYLFWAVGTCFIVFISIFVMPTLGWRYLLAIAAIPLVVFFLACFWLPESPRFDIARGMPDRAMATLERIARDNGKPMPLGKLVDVFAESDQPVKRGQLRDLLTPEMRLTTGLLWFIWLANAFSYYGVVLMTTELFAVGDECHGGSPGDTDLAKAEPPCRLECKQLSVKDYTDLLWTTFAEFPGLFITIGLLEWLGRRRTIALEFLIFAVFVFFVNLCITRTALTAFLFIARAFISGGFQATYVYTPEVYPTTTRALGLGMCSAMARVGAIVTPFVAQVLLRKSVYLAVSSYATICVVAAVVSLLLPIETKGREMKDTHSNASSRPPSRASTALSAE